MTEALRPAKSIESSKQTVMKLFAAFLAIFAVCTSVQAAEIRYVSTRTDKAYLREGPTYAHKVLWLYRHRGYPFVVTAQFDTWRRVQAPDGAVGWMSAAMLTDKRTVLVTGQGRAKITASADGGKLTALADPGAVADLKACTVDACRIHGDSVDGWIAKSRIWGVGADEVFEKLPRR
jgi:SH3-like domain-containing protein